MNKCNWLSIPFALLLVTGFPGCNVDIIDANGDGTISLEELDADGDGTISRSDLIVAFFNAIANCTDEGSTSGSGNGNSGQPSQPGGDQLGGNDD